MRLSTFTQLCGFIFSPYRMPLGRTLASTGGSLLSTFCTHPECRHFTCLVATNRTRCAAMVRCTTTILLTFLRCVCYCDIIYLCIFFLYRRTCSRFPPDGPQTQTQTQHAHSEKDPYPVDALPTCNHALSVCQQERKCIKLFENFKTHCKVRDNKCRMDDR